MIDPEIRAQLSGYRQSIDNIDAALVHMLAERFKCTRKVGVFKATHGLPPGRSRRQEHRDVADFIKRHVDPEFLLNLPGHLCRGRELRRVGLAHVLQPRVIDAAAKADALEALAQMQCKAAVHLFIKSARV